MPNRLKTELLKAAVADGCALDMDVQVLSIIDSTNSWSLQQCKAGKSLPFAVYAEAQTQGRGRRGKQWLMPAGSNIAMSLAWTFDLSRETLYLLPLSIAVAIARTLESFGLRQVMIKWPNDIYVSGKKIAGILIETVPIKSGINVDRAGKSERMAVVIGIGLNYDMAAFVKKGLQEKPGFTDICEQISVQHIDSRPERDDVAARLLHFITDTCQNYRKQADNYLEIFRSRYDCCYHENVEILLDNNERLSGVAQGVTDRAELLVTVDGEEQVFNSADVSVRAGTANAGPERK